MLLADVDQFLLVNIFTSHAVTSIYGIMIKKIPLYHLPREIYNLTRIHIFVHKSNDSNKLINFRNLRYIEGIINDIKLLKRYSGIIICFYNNNIAAPEDLLQINASFIYMQKKVMNCIKKEILSTLESRGTRVVCILKYIV